MSLAPWSPSPRLHRSALAFPPPSRWLPPSFFLLPSSFFVLPPSPFPLLHSSFVLPPHLIHLPSRPRRRGKDASRGLTRTVTEASLTTSGSAASSRSVSLSPKSSLSPTASSSVLFSVSSVTTSIPSAFSPPGYHLARGCAVIHLRHKTLLNTSPHSAKWRQVFSQVLRYVPCTAVLCSVHCTVHTVQCTLYTLHCTLFSVQCTVYITLRPSHHSCLVWTLSCEDTSPPTQASSWRSGSGQLARRQLASYSSYLVTAAIPS